MKKQVIFLAITVIVLSVIALSAIYKYNSVPQGVSLQQAVQQRDDALTSLNIERTLNQNDLAAITNLTKDKKQLTTVNTALCAQIKTAKLVQPLCK